MGRVECLGLRGGAHAGMWFPAGIHMPPDESIQRGAGPGRELSDRAHPPHGAFGPRGPHCLTWGADRPIAFFLWRFLIGPY